MCCVFHVLRHACVLTYSFLFYCGTLRIPFTKHFVFTVSYQCVGTIQRPTQQFVFHVAVKEPFYLSIAKINDHIKMYSNMLEISDWEDINI